jgi:hypothetical protein
VVFGGEEGEGLAWAKAGLTYFCIGWRTSSNIFTIAAIAASGCSISIL